MKQHLQHNAKTWRHHLWLPGFLLMFLPAWYYGGQEQTVNFPPLHPAYGRYYMSYILRLNYHENNN